MTLTTVRVDVHPEAATPPALRRQVLALQRQAWRPDEPGDTAPEGPTHDPALAPVSVLLVEGDIVLAALDVLGLHLVHAGSTWAARGLSTVVVAERARGRGLGLTLVRAAGELIDAAGADVTVFTCDRPLRGFYEAAGYAVLAGTVIVGGTPAEPLRSDAPGFDKITLGRFHSGRAQAARSAFVGVDLGLHPGRIDRLW